MTTVGRQRLRIATVAPLDGPDAALTRELTAALAQVAPEIAVTSCGIGEPDGATADLTIDASDPTAYRRAVQRLAALGTTVALIQHRVGRPDGRYLLGLSDELFHHRIPYLLVLQGLRPNPRPVDADVVRALTRGAAGVLVPSDQHARLVERQRLAAPDSVAVLTGGAGADAAHLLAGLIHLAARRAPRPVHPVGAR